MKNIKIFKSLLFLLITAHVCYSWYSSDFKYRKKLTFNVNLNSENLTDFPLLIKLYNTNFEYGRLAYTNGFDIRFVDNDDTTLLNYHFETWKYNGDSLIWVRIPQLDDGSSDFIYIYFGVYNFYTRCRY